MSQTSRSSQLALPKPHHGTHHWLRLVDKRANRQPLVGVRVRQQINQPEAVLGPGIVQVVDAGDIDQQVETVLLLEEFQDFVDPLRRDNHARGARNSLVGKSPKTARRAANVSAMGMIPYFGSCKARLVCCREAM